MPFTVCGWSRLPVNNSLVSTDRSMSFRPSSRSCAVAFPGGLRRVHSSNIFSFIMATSICPSALMSSRSWVFRFRLMPASSHSFPSVLATCNSCLLVRACPAEQVLVLLSGKRWRQPTHRKVKSSWNTQEIYFLNLLYWDQSSHSKEDSGSPDSSTVQHFLLATFSSDSHLFIFRPPFSEDKIKRVWGVRLSLQTCDKPMKCHIIIFRRTSVICSPRSQGTQKNTYLFFVSLASLPSCHPQVLGYEKGSSVLRCQP